MLRSPCCHAILCTIKLKEWSLHANKSNYNGKDFSDSTQDRIQGSQLEAWGFGVSVNGLLNTSSQGLRETGPVFTSAMASSVENDNYLDLKRCEYMETVKVPEGSWWWSVSMPGSLSKALAQFSNVQMSFLSLGFKMVGKAEQYSIDGALFDFLVE